MSKKIENDEFKRAVAEAIERASEDDELCRQLKERGYDVAEAIEHASEDDVNHSNLAGSGGRREPQIDQAQLEADIRLLIQLFGTPVRKNQAKEPDWLGRPSPSRFRH